MENAQPNTVIRVLHDSVSTEPGTLSMRTGDLATLLEVKDLGWCVLRTTAGHKGYFPMSYIEPAPSGGAMATRPHEVQVPKPPVPTLPQPASAATSTNSSLESRRPTVTLERIVPPIPAREDRMVSTLADKQSPATVSEQDEGKEETATISEMFRYATAFDVLLMLVGFVGMGAVGASQPLMMVLFGDLMDVLGKQVAGATMRAAFNTIALNMLYLALGSFVCAWTGEACWKVSGLRQSAMWRKTYLTAILRQDITWFDVNNPGQLSSKIAENTQLIEQGIGSKLGLGSRMFVQGLAGLAIAFYYAWDMALVLLALAPIPMFGAWFFSYASTTASGEVSAAYSKAGSTANESLSELRTVAALAAETRQADKYVSCLDEAKMAGIRKSYKCGFANGLLFSSGNLMAAAGFLFGSWKIKTILLETYDANVPRYWPDGKGGFVEQRPYHKGANCANGGPEIEKCGFSGGNLMIAMFAVQIGAQGLGLVEPAMTALARARKSAKQVISTADRKVIINSFSDLGQKLSSVVGNISFKNVFFSYPSRPEQRVCNGYNLEVAAGKTVALVGSSGSGKSTIIQLLERFYDPDSGVVMLDGVDLRQLNVRWLRMQIGLVGQEPVLFSGTIAENISYGKPGSTRADVEAAARMANAFDFIQDFPDKFDTDVGEKGGQLSGGQKQRIAIARAMIKNPAVLLLDEATSALDTESERIVQAALDDLLQKHKRTTIVIAHRLSTIRNADKIAVVDKGKIVEEGTHDELMSIGEHGWYFKLNFKSNAGAEPTLMQSVSSQSLCSLTTYPLGSIYSNGTEHCDYNHVSGSVVFADSKEKVGWSELKMGPAVDTTREVEQAKEAEAANEKKKRKGNAKRIWNMHEGDSFHFFIGFLGAILVGTATPSIGIIFVKCIWCFFMEDPDQVWSEAVKWALLIILVAVCQIVGDTMRGWGFGVPGEKLTVKLRMMYYNALVRQEIGWHDMPENSSGSLCAALATEVNLIQGLSGEAMGRNVLFICEFAACFTFAFYFGHWAITLVAIAMLPVIISGIAIRLAMMKGGAANQGNQGLGVDAGKIVGEVVTSVRTVASFTLEQQMSERFTIATDTFVSKNLVPGALKGVLQGYGAFALMASFSMLYWFGGEQVGNGRTDFEGMLIPIFCMIMLGLGLGQATNGATDAAKAAAAANRVFEIVDRQPLIDYTSETGVILGNVVGNISLRNVTFSYPSRPEQRVCNGYNLEVAAGKTVALVGSSGSGKSTIIQLLERFYDPDSGVVMLDGVDLRQLNVRWLRMQIGLVGQEPVLFSGTIAENISYGKPGSTRADVEAAARMANAFDFIQDFPDKFDTDVGEKGGQLSGGQKQRIAIARAMIKNPAVLLLDEATSALDTESERIVQAALDDLLQKHKRTTIVIAHRLSTIRNADKIAVVDKGKIVEEGTHDELMSKGELGRFFKLNHQQGL